jgi:hypothetical protein
MSLAADAEVQAALSRNDRYLQEFIEALAICPYARSCRETGRLHREVRLSSEPDADQMAAHILALQDVLSSDIEVGLIILPHFTLSSRDFERFVSQVQRTYQQGQQAKGLSVAFFVVAFHPDLPMLVHNQNVAVRFMRRSPDPTIQLVRPGAIERVRGERPAEVVSRQIAETGWKTVTEAGPEKLSAMLGEIAASFRAAINPVR